MYVELRTKETECRLVLFRRFDENSKPIRVWVQQIVLLQTTNEVEWKFGCDRLQRLTNDL